MPILGFGAMPILGPGAMPILGPGMGAPPQRAGTGAGAVVAALQDSLEAEAGTVSLARAFAGRRPGTDTEAAGD